MRNLTIILPNVVNSIKKTIRSSCLPQQIMRKRLICGFASLLAVFGLLYLRVVWAGDSFGTNLVGFSNNYPIQGWLRNNGAWLPTGVSGFSENFLVNGHPTVHPNGTLIKKKTDQTYYVLVDSQKRGIPSPDVLHNLHDGENSEVEYNDVVTISDAEFNSYPTGPPVNSPLPSNGRSQPNGRLITAPGRFEVSIVSDGNRRPFTDANIGMNSGFAFYNMIEVADYDSYPLGPLVDEKYDIWISNGPTGGIINSLVTDPNNPFTIYAVTHGAVGFKSINGGVSWTRMAGVKIAWLAIDPNNTRTLYSGDGFGLFKSLDEGSTWSQINIGLPPQIFLYTQALVIDPKKPSTFYVCTSSSGVFKSSDGGANWEAINTRNALKAHRLAQSGVFL